MIVSLLLPSRTSLGLSLAACAALSLIACKKGDPEKCTQAQTVVHTAVEAGDFASARQWREYAYKACEDQSSLPALDQSIVDKEGQATAKKAAEEKQKQDTALFAKAFFEFVAQNRAAPDHASQAPVCDAPPADAPAPKPGVVVDRLCTATRLVGAHSIETRYSDADHGAFRFTTTLDSELDCKALGGTVSKQWDVPAVGGKAAKRTRCDLGGALQGLTAVLTAAGQAPLYVVSPSYVTHDPGWRAILEGP